MGVARSTIGAAGGQFYERKTVAAAGRFRLLQKMAAVPTTHRQPLEYLGGVRRFPVPENKISWSADFPGYQPVDYTAPRVLAAPAWADPDIRSQCTQCHSL